MRTALTLSLLLALAPAATAQKVYTCRTADGALSYQDTPCGPAKEESVQEMERPKRHTPSPEQTQREAAWTQLCEAQDRYINYVMRCVSRHRSAYYDMATIVRNPQSTAVQTEKATQCFARWIKPVIDEVDAVMWRHCYYN